ncbi:P1 family peptidase, partial [Candidatus Poribacteria bacterium]|nr:P1 family peptidase [Candidatus Poribacteria bacterium]
MSLAPNDTITAIPGIRVGHATDARAATGCTVVLCEAGAVAGVDVRGSAPGTRETDAIRPGRLVREAHGILLTGGSAFGLDAAGGVMRYLEERGVGYAVGSARVPIVPAAVIFDLGVGDGATRPDATMGYAACQAAATGPVPVGRVGAGAGATVGKARGCVS